MPKFDIDVQLSGKEGNAFYILGRVKGALRKGGITDAEMDAFIKEATADDYDHLLRTCMKWVNVL